MFTSEFEGYFVCKMPKYDHFYHICGLFGGGGTHFLSHCMGSEGKLNSKLESQISGVALHCTVACRISPTIIVPLSLFSNATPLLFKEHFSNSKINSSTIFGQQLFHAINRMQQTNLQITY